MAHVSHRDYCKRCAIIFPLLSDLSDRLLLQLSTNNGDLSSAMAIDLTTALSSVTNTASTVMTSKISLVSTALLLLILTLTIAFCYTQTTNSLSTRIKKHMSISHAYTTEFIQLLLLAIGFLDIYFTATSGFDLHSLRSPTVLNTIIMLLLLTRTTAFVLAVDTIETVIVLGSWTHPFQPQTFVLTRNLVWPASVKTRGKNCVAVPGPKKGGVVVVARKGEGLHRVEKVAWVMRPVARRASAASVKAQMKEISKMRKLRGMRRHSFPYGILNTGALVRDSRATDIASEGQVHNGDHGDSGRTDGPDSQESSREGKSRARSDSAIGGHGTVKEMVGLLERMRSL